MRKICQRQRSCKSKNAVAFTRRREEDEFSDCACPDPDDRSGSAVERIAVPVVAEPAWERNAFVRHGHFVGGFQRVAPDERSLAAQTPVATADAPAADCNAVAACQSVAAFD